MERSKETTELRKALKANFIKQHNASPEIAAIQNIYIDSRLLTTENARQAIFVALKGSSANGHEYIESAIRAGVRLIIHSDDLEEYRAPVCYWQVQDTRRALSSLANCFYGEAAKQLKIIGVTGTDGKSSTSYMIYQLLQQAAYKCGLLSTFAIDLGRGLRANPKHQTTPESLEIHSSLAEMLANGVEYVIIESSSHGLSLKTSRLADIIFRVGVFTNLSPEHLEFHGTMEQYAQDKANLFRHLDGSAIINYNDEYAPVMANAALTENCTAAGTSIVKYKKIGSAAGSQELKTLSLSKITASVSSSKFEFTYLNHLYSATINIPCDFYIDNAMLALLACCELTHSTAETWLDYLGTLKAPKGRMQVLNYGQNFTAIMDYAHSPGAFAKLLPQLKQHCLGNLIVLFGSAGERDTKKRPKLGALADKFADIIILCDEDPRSEKPRTILEDIRQGITAKTLNIDLFLLCDRQEAINKACSLAKQEDTLLLLGKGHENTIIYENGELAWDEEAAFKAALRN